MAKKKLTAKQRDAKIYRTLVDFLKDKSTKVSFSKPFDSKEVESLFQTSIWGHREIILTILMARLLNPKFKASENFYACNPRSLFEHPIREALREYAIPHRKSGPLNVAKNSKKINKDWATDKHGGDIAMNVVKIVKKIESVSEKDLHEFAAAYAVPDGGASPQIVIGLLMEAAVKDRKASVLISGHRDSVSTTNTTSKKPGDIVEKINGDSQIIYEITTKIFSDDRMIESYESVMDYDKSLKDVVVICRPQDVPESLSEKKTSYVMATTQFRELAYYFINIYDYIQSSIILLTPAGRKTFYEELIRYVNDTNTSEKVKRYFKQWHADNKSL